MDYTKGTWYQFLDNLAAFAIGFGNAAVKSFQYLVYFELIINKANCPNAYALEAQEEAIRSYREHMDNYDKDVYLVVQNAKTQSPIAFGAGEVTEAMAEYAITAPLFEAGAAAKGGGKLAQFVVGQLGENAQDLVLSTLPLYLDMLEDPNLTDEQKAEIILEDVRNNVIGNAAAYAILSLLPKGVAALVKKGLDNNAANKAFAENVAEGAEKLAKLNEEGYKPPAAGNVDDAIEGVGKYADNEKKILSKVDDAFDGKAKIDDDLKNGGDDKPKDNQDKKEVNTVKPSNKIKLKNSGCDKNGKELEGEVKRINEMFRGDQFKGVDNPEAKLTPEAREELCRINEKSTCKFGEAMGVADQGDHYKYLNNLTPEELQKIKDYRNSIPKIEKDTIMQKVINPQDKDAYLNGSKKTVGGCVSRAEDVAPYTNNLEETVESLRLDYYAPGQYDGSEYLKAAAAGEDMYVMRFTSNNTPGNNVYPSLDFNGAPCTGTGITGSKYHLIPEYNYSIAADGRFVSEGQKISSGAIFKVDKLGNETIIGIWDGKKFMPVG